jgi:NADPH:quinone reductase-like Zn-dependent oxidoreductase
MKAATRKQYGPPSVIQIRELEKPVPKANELLIRVHATTVNRTDCAFLTGTPWIMRLFLGLSRPKQIVTGTDFAGVVEAVGSIVTGFKPGDRVWGFDDSGIASHAEFITIPHTKAIAFIPAGLNFQPAVAGAEGAHYAYNCMNKVKLAPGQNAMVNGGTGAIGSALIQLLKAEKIVVTATCNKENISHVKSLGADRIIDYTSTDFTEDAERFDYVFDAVGKSSFKKCKRLLKPKGVYMSSEVGRRGANIFLALLTPLSGGKKVIFPIPSNIKASLALINKLVEEKKFSPLIDSIYPLEKISEAFTRALSGQKNGNIILSMD